MEKFDAVDVIRTKRDGGALSHDQIRWVVDACATVGSTVRTRSAVNTAVTRVNGRFLMRSSFETNTLPCVDAHSLL